MSNININRLNPYQLHKHLINEYYLKKRGDTKKLTRDTSKDKTDYDVIRENHKFLWETDETPENLTWEKKLAKRYYDKLFKEYCICDLSRYRENKVALRWRVEKEVIDGKGQFSCGSKQCQEKDSLRSWEVNFAYLEDNEKQNALVKVRLCPDCSEKLNYRSKKREIKRCKKLMKKSSKSKRYTENLSESSKEYEATEDENSREHETNEQSEEIPENAETEEVVPQIAVLDENVWAKGPEIEVKNREEEFDEYLADLLL